MKRPDVKKTKSFPGSIRESDLLIYDRKLAKLDFFERWSDKFSSGMVFPVTAGESLKDVHRFPKFIEKVLKRTQGESAHTLRVFAVGGGSVGDFAGFVASVLKRGVPLIHIPSTWLAAIDSSHGGKTALNVPPFKNQIGTFKSADKIYLVKDLLTSQPERLARQSFSEMLKMALIEGGSLWEGLSSTSPSSRNLEKRIWKFLLPAIEAKYRVVEKDPYETKKIRQVLNLGHTVGHVIEGHYGLSHGESVALGLVFTIQLSHRMNWMKEKHRTEVLDCMKKYNLGQKKLDAMTREKFLLQLKQDKKASGRGKVNFVVLERPGKTSIRNLGYQKIVDIAQELGWVR